MQERGITEEVPKMFDPDKTASMGSAKDPAYDEFATQPMSSEKPKPELKQPVVDEAKANLLLQQLRNNQNVGMGIFGGLGAALIGSVVWALMTSLTGYQIGFMAIGVGFLVGYAVRRLGQGVDPVFGFIGAGLALIGCVVGNLLTTCVIASMEEGVPMMQVLGSLNLDVAIEIMKYTFSPIDLIFYGLALYYGYKFSFRQLTESELKSITRPQTA
jgi:uncharacterized membrane protein